MATDPELARLVPARAERLGKVGDRYELMQYTIRLERVPSVTVQPTQRLRELSEAPSKRDKWYSIAEASVLSGISESELLRLARKQTIKSKRVKGKPRGFFRKRRDDVWLVRWDSVLDYLRDTDSRS